MSREPLLSLKTFLLLSEIRDAILENLREDDAKLEFVDGKTLKFVASDDGESQDAVSFPLVSEEDMEAWRAGVMPPSIPETQFEFISDTIRRAVAAVIAEKGTAARVRIGQVKVMSETPEFVILIMGFGMAVE